MIKYQFKTVKDPKSNPKNKILKQASFESEFGNNFTSRILLVYFFSQNDTLNIKLITILQYFLHVDTSSV
jgi:hypothetical protein